MNPWVMVNNVICLIARAHALLSKRLLFIDDKMKCGERNFFALANGFFNWIGIIEKYCWQTDKIHLPSNFRNGKKNGMQ